MWIPVNLTFLRSGFLQAAMIQDTSIFAHTYYTFFSVVGLTVHWHEFMLTEPEIALRFGSDCTAVSVATQYQRYLRPCVKKIDEALKNGADCKELSLISIWDGAPGKPKGLS